jgi:hypothetical protein
MTDQSAWLMEREALLEALWQLLDDMGPDDHCVCEAAKRQAMDTYRASLPNEPQDEWPSAFDAPSASPIWGPHHGNVPNKAVEYLDGANVGVWRPLPPYEKGGD